MSPTTSTTAKPGTDAGGRMSRQDDAIVEAAWCYYHEGLNQSAIATKLGVSRASVVNYLAESRRRDFVRVTLDSNVFLYNQLAAELRHAFDLTQALVIPADEASSQRSFERVVRAASDWLPQLLDSGDMLGVAWGETIYRLSEIAPRLTLEELVIVQLVGSRPSALGFAAENCSATLAQRFGAQCINLHVPLLLSNSALCRQLIAEPVVAEQLQRVADCSKVIFAAGTCFDDSHIVRTGIISPKEIAGYRRKGAVGVICGRLIDIDGNAMAIPSEDRMIGVTLEQMREKELGLLVCAEPERASAARAAIAGGYVTHFACCSTTARLLLEGIA
ncbi:sugar-binding transcriptional regulator [Granulosicoccus sp. 3-233]|uniref:sugar-binding transcriptional regulator n=1 Tax=Granulosicoccus sp. 3-233 TaxID=3417969 RepID=UPI003D330A37